MFARPLTVCLALALVASLATSALATCMADPSMSAEAQMACCSAGHDECPMRGSAGDCCKIESQTQQPVAVAKAEPIQSTVTAPALVAVVIVGSLDAIAPARAVRLPDIDPLRIPSTPHHFLASTLLI
jgi:hypothetical protein